MLLVINGSWKVAGNLVELKKEKARLKELSAEGLDDIDMVKNIRNDMMLSGLMAFTGCLGLFIFISKTTKKQVHKSINEKKS